MNELLFLCQALFVLTGVILAFRFFGRKGLVIWAVISIVIANILACKITYVMGFTIGASCSYAASFLSTDLLTEYYGKKEANRTVALVLFSSVSVIIMTQLFLALQTHPDSEWSRSAYECLFGLLPRIALASFVATGIAQFHDVWAYDWWRNKFPSDKHLWIRNNFSTLASQTMNTILFHNIAFYGLFPTRTVWQLIAISFFLKYGMAILDTPFIYFSKYLWNKGLVPDKEETLSLQKKKIKK